MSAETNREQIHEREFEREKVKKAFAEFNLNFKIEKYPELIERLADIGEHFHDAVEMARMMEMLWPIFKERLKLEDADKDDVITATLLHDIGKSGPWAMTNESAGRAMMKNLFPHKFLPGIDTFGKLVEVSGLKLKEIVDELPRNVELYASMPATDFWRYHVDWTYDILKQEQVPKKIVDIAASHHVLEGKNPAHIPPEEIPYSAQAVEIVDNYHTHSYDVLAIIDKYQAIRERKHQKKHDDIVLELARMIERSKYSPDVKERYYEILDIFADNEDLINAALKRNGDNSKDIAA